MTRQEMIESMTLTDEQSVEVVKSVIGRDEYRLGILHAQGVNVSVAVDVGSHVGSFTRMVKYYWPAAKVIAIEPGPDTAEAFRKNTEGLLNVSLHEVAIAEAGHRTNVVLMDSADGNSAARFTVECVEKFQQIPGNHNYQPVKASRFLAILEQHGMPKIDLLKLDCEGAEGIVLQELADAGLLGTVGEIVGEYHHAHNADIIERLLPASHVLTLYRQEWAWGAFFAHPIKKT